MEFVSIFLQGSEIDLVMLKILIKNSVLAKSNQNWILTDVLIVGWSGEWFYSGHY